MLSKQALMLAASDQLEPEGTMLDEDEDENEGDEDEDEDSGPTCPFCDAEPGCKHLVAFFEGGPTCETWCGVVEWDQFEAVVRTHFAPLLTADLKRIRWSREEVQRLWTYAIEETPPEQRWADFEIEHYALGVLVREALLDSGAQEFEGYTHSAGGEWPAAAFYARRPASVFKESINALGQVIDAAAPKPRPTGRRAKTSSKAAKRK